MTDMPISEVFIGDEQRLDLTFEGKLDVSISRDILRIRKGLTAEVKTCIMDLTGVDWLFDSGIALLRALCRRLQELGATVVVLGDQRRLRAELPVTVRYSDQPSRPVRQSLA
jgi:ABC-type transporter Mla MlaB component